MEEQIKEQIKEQKEKVKLVQGSSTFELIIPANVEAKIRHLCSVVHNLEWSGILFYKKEGSFDDGSFKATCLDICVMDIGTSTFTDFLDTPDIISYRIDHPELLQSGVYESLIHSHQSFSSFFSGTDMDTLLKEGSNLNHFLSLIVNNAGEYVARITRKLVRKVTAEAHIIYTESSSYNTFENEEIKLTQDKKSETDKKEEKSVTTVEWFNMTIIKQEVSTPFEDIDARLREIRNKKFNNDNSYSWHRFETQSPRQLNLFENQANQINQSRGLEGFTRGFNRTKEEEELNEIKEEQESLPICLTESANKQIIKRLCYNLLCGSILVDTNARIEIEAWVRKMDKLYENRFGDLSVKKNYQELEIWIEQMIEFLICNHPDPMLESRVVSKYNYVDKDDCVQIYAYDMIQFLDELPSSNIKEFMINKLETYLPDGIEEYIRNQESVNN